MAAIKKSPVKRKTHLNKIHSQLNKLKKDAVDREVIKRFRIIIDSLDYDITRNQCDEILNDPKGLDISSYPEILHPYLKHYSFMVKRDER